MADLDQLRHPDNLRRAWRRIRANPDAAYKSLSRPVYQHFAIAEETLLDDLAAPAWREARAELNGVPLAAEVWRQS